MTLLSALEPHGRLLRRRIRATRQDTVFLAAGVVPHMASVLVWIWLGFKPVVRSVHSPWEAGPPLVVVLVLLPLVALPLTRVQRWRHRELIGVELPPFPSVPEPATGRRLGLRHLPRLFASASTWRQAAYHAVLGPFIAAAELLVLAAWTAGIAATTVYVWMWVVPDGRFMELTAIRGLWVTAGGLLLLAVTYWLVGVVSRTETRWALLLLGPSRAQRLQRRVTDLTSSRSDLAEAADAERRRIERDLHDGTQQRLVSLAVNLGLARATLKDMPDEVHRVIDEAHREAKEAIIELNGLVRGLHPAVLDDRGLDAALSGLAARVPSPVRLQVDLDGRATRRVESAAYFVVSEALTNVTKHARATAVDVTVRRIGKVLQVEVTDDGVGGADAVAGTGLSGLAKRVGALDGVFRISSPVGGPTTVTAELPWEPQCGR
ncbi:sensor histidine kinase [Streptomyces sp. 7R007]